MTARPRISDSEDDSDIAARSSAPEGEGSILSHRPRNSAKPNTNINSNSKPKPKPVPQPKAKATSITTRARDSNSEDAIAVVVSGPSNPEEYRPYQGDTVVETVLQEIDQPDGKLCYKIEFESGRKEKVSVDKLLQLPNGRNALDLYNNSTPEGFQEELKMSSAVGKRTRMRTINNGFVDSSLIPDDEEDEPMSNDDAIVKKRRLAKGKVSALTAGSRHSSRVSSRIGSRAPSRTIHDEESSGEEAPPSNKRTTRQSGRTVQSALKLASNPGGDEDDDEDDDDDDDEDANELAGEAPEDEDEMDDSDEGSDIVFAAPKSKRVVKIRASSRGQPGEAQRAGNGRRENNRSKRSRRRDDFSESETEEPTRRSGRERVVKNMRELDMEEEIYADEVTTTNIGSKVISIREIYQPVSKQSPFHLFHNNVCDTCKGVGTNSNKGTSPLVHCQGCSTSIHKVCLGYRAQREHMVTKIGHENFVLQCRRCIGIATKKDSFAPRLDVCPTCKKPGAACAAFSPKRTAKQEETLRNQHEGDDPITEVPLELINNEANVLFRCVGCQRGYHFHHLPATKPSSDQGIPVQQLRSKRLKQYGQSWQCKDCSDAPAKVQTLVAWRPLSREKAAGMTVEELDEDEKEYLIKWEDRSYFQCSWMSGSWVWGVTAAVMRKAFFRRGDGVNSQPKWTAEEAIPEEYLRMEIIFDVSYSDGFRPKSLSGDKAAIHMVEEVFVKFQGLTYDEAVWEEPPDPKDDDRWADFVAAYNEYVAGKYFAQSPQSSMKERLQTFRSLNFEKKVELKKQPSALVGGKMMPYQMEGLNWLLYNFHQEKNVILADEMGLGKTIQIISLMASLVKDNPKCWPFLIVTPNSTCPNWRREIKKWAPSLRVVAYYGGKKAKDMAMQYELFPDGCADLRAHVVITSYEAPVEDGGKSFFRRVKWAGMIVDEGQRLKNDENLLYGALKALKIPFQVLLTGTPLQNNKRELFNLLQFLDTSVNAADLDDEYQELTKENLPRLHDFIRPFFLRRTKLQVLKFLPPMAQVILPVTMSVVQKKLYKSILAKNPQLIKSIFGHTNATLRPADRGNLNNILMQLRKCLCHPFLYSQAIEERSLGEKALHRNLVDASAKFQLLEIMLPKLRERGHRVLLFSQFLLQLDLVEDFLNGMDLSYQRLDGTIGALEKQKRIDAFNAPESPLFAFLLSTRAGGVGINLATADTVIIMDPDYNPHQDLQALSRAHRIGQKNKVLVFQLMTKDSAEEKIVQIGRKKMALDQALIESMGAEDDAGVDLESILKHGAEALFNDDDRNDIHYDSASVDKLLDRTQVENTNGDDDKTAESQFSFARVWANDKGDLTDDVEDVDAEQSAPNPSVWDKILKQREADAAEEAARNLQTFGRGRRTRNAINYEKQDGDLDEDIADPSPAKKRGKRRSEDSADDADFQGGADSPGEESEHELDGVVDPRELESHRENVSSHDTSQTAPPQQSPHMPKETPPKPNSKSHKKALKQNLPPVDNLQQLSSIYRVGSNIPINPPGHVSVPRPRLHEPVSQIRPHQQMPPARTTLDIVSSNAHSIEPIFNSHGHPVNPNYSENPIRPPFCTFCNSEHFPGHCRPPNHGVEICRLCSIAHFGGQEVCGHLKNEVNIRLKLDELRNSAEPRQYIDSARDYLRQLLAEKAMKRRSRSKQ